jgi:hypothetical protein
MLCQKNMRAKVDDGIDAEDMAIHMQEEAAGVDDEDGDGGDDSVEGLLVDGLGTKEPPEAGDAEDGSDQSW